MNIQKCVKSFTILPRDGWVLGFLYSDKIDKENLFCVIHDRKNVFILHTNENKRSAATILLKFVLKFENF